MKRTTSWLLLAIALLALGTLLGGRLYVSFQETEKLERDRLVHQVNIVERNLALQLQTTSNALEAIRDDLPELLKQPPAPNRRLVAAVNTSFGIRTFSVVNREGEVIASSRLEVVGQNFRDESRFSTIRAANDPDRLYISAPFQSQLGHWSITLGRSLRDADGNFAGCILAFIEPGYFGNLLGSTRYTPNVRAALVHGQGQIIYRIPDAEGITGQDLSRLEESSFYKHMQSGEPLSFFSLFSPTASEDRLFANRTVWPKAAKADQPLVAVVSRASAEIFASWRQDCITTAALFAMLVLASALGLAFYQRRQAAYERLLSERRREREQAAAQLQRSEERGRLATEGADVGVWYWNQLTGTLDWSDITKRHFGLPPEQVVSFEHFYQAIHQDDRDRERVRALLEHSQEILEDFRTEYRVVHPDGSELWLAGMGRYYLDDDGKVIGMGGVTLDITEHKRAELAVAQGKHQVELLNRQLEKRAIDAETAKRAKDAFLRAVSHELRTPLNHIMGGTDLLLRGQPDAKQEKWLRAIRESADKLFELVKQILFAAEEGGNLTKLDQVEFLPASALEEVRQILLNRAHAKGLTLVVGDTDDVPERLVGDPTRLAQALFNYVDNSIKFSDHGTVTLSAQTLAREAQSVVVRFTVSDTGIGIAPEVREKLFSTFEQGDPSMTRKYSGLGIGLANTRELARLMGGEVGVDDVAGGGSAFWLTARFALSPAASDAAA